MTGPQTKTLTKYVDNQQRARLIERRYANSEVAGRYSKFVFVQPQNKTSIQFLLNMELCSPFSLRNIFQAVELGPRKSLSLDSSHIG